MKHHGREWHWNYRVNFRLSWSQVKMLLKYGTSPFIYPKSDPVLRDWHHRMKKNFRRNKIKDYI